MPNEIELKPCPFCGAQGRRSTWHRTLWEISHATGCFLSGSPVFDDTIAAWNMRHSSPLDAVARGQHIAGTGKISLT